jgi:hypothetical protein
MAARISEGLVNCCKLLLYILNSFFIAIGLMVIGLGIYFLLYKGDILSVIFRMEHIYASNIIVIFCGSFLFAMGIYGLIMTYSKNGYLLFIYMVLMFLCAFLSLSAAIIAIVYKVNWHIDRLRQEMRNDIQNFYGVNLNVSENLEITRTWDTVQQYWYCCAVEDNSWGVYRQSEWYNDQPGDVGSKEYTSKMVPESCCVKNQYGNYINLQKCQNWILGPPNLQSSSDKNEAVFYKGCFIIGKDIMHMIGSGIIGLGFGLAVLMVIGAVAAFLLWCSVKSHAGKTRKPTSKLSGYFVAPRHELSTGSFGAETSGGHRSKSPVELQPLEGSWRRDESA